MGHTHDRLCPMSGDPAAVKAAGEHVNLCLCETVRRLRIEMGWDVARLPSAGIVNGHPVVFHGDAVRVVRGDTNR